MTKTVGEVFDEQGPCTLMAKVVQLAEMRKRIPFGEWDYTFTTDPKWRLIVNGGTREEWQPTDAFAPVKRFEAAVEYNGWLVASFNAVAGAVIGKPEQQIIDAFDAELRA